MTQLPTDEFDDYYLAMVLHSDQVNKQIKAEMEKAKAKEDD